MNRSPAAAYDAIAAGYDDQVAVDGWVRKRLRCHMLRRFRPGDRLLDVGCGTGLETLFLAARGMHVTGLDISPGMLAQLQAKAVATGLQEQVTLVEGEASVLSEWPAHGYDGIISTFAALNTVADLGAFATDAARLLRPGGRLVVHMLNRFSLWEWLLALARPDASGRRAARQRLRQQTERTFVIGGQSVVHQLYTADMAYLRFFAPHFRLCERYAMGALRPPPGVRRLPRPLVAVLGRLDAGLGHYRPFCHWGRFFVLDLEKRTV